LLCSISNANQIRFNFLVCVDRGSFRTRLETKAGVNRLSEALRAAEMVKFDVYRQLSRNEVHDTGETKDRRNFRNSSVRGGVVDGDELILHSGC
jgi:hypothetical protein